MKGYAGGLTRIGVLLQHIGLLGFRPDDVGVSFTVLAGLFARTALYMTETDPGAVTASGQMCEGSTSRIALRRFQLESLILAQNERWRQA